MEMNESETAIIKEGESMPVRQGIIRPIVKVDEALEAWKEYQNLKTKLADKGDFVSIQGKQHPTKQFANKLSKFFGLSVEIVRAEKESGDAPDVFTWHIWARATAPNGQFRDGDGHCSSRERKFSHLEHDVYATAVTRAKNRAILELAGFGEVSAEEIQDEDSDKATHEEKPTVLLTSPKDGKKYPVTMAGALRAFAEIKKRIGNDAYYDCLTTFQVDHANQIPFRDMPKVFDIMLEIARGQGKYE